MTYKVITIGAGDKEEFLYLFGAISDVYKNKSRISRKLVETYRFLSALHDEIVRSSNLKREKLSKAKQLFVTLGEGLYSEDEWNRLDANVRQRRSRRKRKELDRSEQKENIAIRVSLKMRLHTLIESGGFSSYDEVVNFLYESYKERDKRQAQARRMAKEAEMKAKMIAKNHKQNRKK